MKIADSSVSMGSTHKEFAYSRTEAVSIEASASKDLTSAILSISEEGLSYKESADELKKREAAAAKKQQDESLARSLKHMADEMKARDKDQYKVPQNDDSMIKLLRRLLAMLRGKKPDPEDEIKAAAADTSAAFSSSASMSLSASEVSVSGISAALGSGAGTSGTAWQRVTAVSGFHIESEVTTFASQGIAVTEDGRRLGFNIELSMTRAFMEETNVLQSELFYKRDPLVINLDSNVTSVSDQKFLFDLDADGKEENVSFAGKGSGFLAYDKNGDGKINDGSELFGTKSGDGFKDLAAYDDDGNGWIDENDDIFKRLKVWTKDENGNDRLIDLKQADVGAIYLGNVDTQYSLKNDAHDLNAEIKKTGIYLKESSGAAGTIAHVDLVI